MSPRNDPPPSSSSCLNASSFLLLSSPPTTPLLPSSPAEISSTDVCEGRGVCVEGASPPGINQPLCLCFPGYSGNADLFDQRIIYVPQLNTHLSLACDQDHLAMTIAWSLFLAAVFFHALYCLFVLAQHCYRRGPSPPRWYHASRVKRWERRNDDDDDDNHDESVDPPHRDGVPRSLTRSCTKFTLTTSRTIQWYGHYLPYRVLIPDALLGSPLMAVLPFMKFSSNFEVVLGTSVEGTLCLVMGQFVVFACSQAVLREYFKRLRGRYATSALTPANGVLRGVLKSVSRHNTVILISYALFIMFPILLALASKKSSGPMIGMEYLVIVARGVGAILFAVLDFPVFFILREEVRRSRKLLDAYYASRMEELALLASTSPALVEQHHHAQQEATAMESRERRAIEEVRRLMELMEREISRSIRGLPIVLGMGILISNPYFFRYQCYLIAVTGAIIVLFAPGPKLLKIEGSSAYAVTSPRYWGFSRSSPTVEVRTQEYARPHGRREEPSHNSHTHATGARRERHAEAFVSAFKSHAGSPRHDGAGLNEDHAFREVLDSGQSGFAPPSRVRVEVEEGSASSSSRVSEGGGREGRDENGKTYDMVLE